MNESTIMGQKEKEGTCTVSVFEYLVGSDSLEGQIGITFNIEVMNTVGRVCISKLLEGPCIAHCPQDSDSYTWHL